MKQGEHSGRQRFGDARRVVVKIGSGVLADQGVFRGSVLERLAEEIGALWGQGIEVVVVSSGAVALGVQALKLAGRPRDMASKQAAAAVGQARLANRWSRAFADQERLVGQVLLTHADLHSRTRYLTARHTLQRLLAQGVVPIINENDSVAVEEIKLGDNDLLAALVTGLVGADLLVLLTDIDGLYDADPRSVPEARRLLEVEAGDPRLKGWARGSGTAVGTGGMATKVRAAAMAAQLGVPSVIAPGGAPGALAALLRGEEIGTLVRPGEGAPLSPRKSWLAHATRPKGRVVVDEGARRALTREGRSLLPSGVVAVEGRFEEGEPVEVAGPDGAVFAVGLAAYGAGDVARLAGRRTSEIAEILGASGLDEIIHRDDLVLMA